MPSGSVDRRSFRETGERRGFGQREAADALAKEIPAGGFDTVRAVAQVDHVQVGLEDLLLGEVGLETAGQLQLDQFATEAALAGEMREKGVSHHLHGDGTEALPEAQGGEVAQGGTAGAPPIHAAVIVEPPVLGGDERGPDVSGDLTERHIDPAHIGQTPDARAAAVEHLAPLAGPERLYLGG